MTRNCKSEPTATRNNHRAAPSPIENRCGELQLAGGMRLSKWRKLVGIAHSTAWRMRKCGKLPTVTRYGVHYVTADTIQNFFTDDGSTVRSPYNSGQTPV